MSEDLFSSVTRISNLRELDYECEPLEQSEWSDGDYVVGRVCERPSHRARVESPTGRLIEPLEGERIVGALGRRHATRGIVGDWRSIGPDGRMQVIGGGGVIGRVSSRSPYTYPPVEMEYVGHVTLEGRPMNMDDYVEDVEDRPLSCPVLLILGTSMSAGKTMSARVMTRVLREEGFRVGSCKLTGSGRFHDVLALRDAGAAVIFDFVDVGLPTTVVDPSRFRPRVRQLLSRVEQHDVDVLTVEIGASPLEPYNGEIAIEEVQERVRFTALCATDPYAVVGLESAFGMEPDLISGIATNTEAGIDLIDGLTGIPALNLNEESSKEPLREVLMERFGSS